MKSSFSILYNLNNQGIKTWITRVCEPTRFYNIDVNETTSIGSGQFKSMCFDMSQQNFFNQWHTRMDNGPDTVIELRHMHGTSRSM